MSFLGLYLSVGLCTQFLAFPIYAVAFKCFYLYCVISKRGKEKNEGGDKVGLSPLYPLGKSLQ